MSVIVTKQGQPAQRIEPGKIPQETPLQDYIVRNPEALPLAALRDGLLFLIVAREFSTASGPIDALGLDDEGNLYVIETKLYRNSDQRRVLAQVLDYGAALWKHEGDPKSFRERLEHATRRTLGTDLLTKIRDAFGIDAEAAEKLLTTTEAQVKEGEFRFVVLMDHLDDRLKNLISFINQNSRFDVYGIELEFYSFDDYEITIPKLYGAEARKEVTTSRGTARSVWTEETYFEHASEHLEPQQVDSLRRLYEFAVQHADRVTWGTGTTTGSFNLKYDRLSPTKSILTAYSQGTLDLNFKWLHEAEDPLPEEARALAEHLDRLEGWSLPTDYAITYPRIPIEIWVPQVDAIIEAQRESIPSAKGGS